MIAVGDTLVGGRRTPSCACLFFALLGFISCQNASEMSEDEAETPEPESVSTAIFREVAAEVGLSFRHFNGATGEYLFPEIMGAGAALFDYDLDGDLDIYLIQGTMLANDKLPREALFPPAADEPPANRLFRNNLVERGELRFAERSREAGVADQGYGMGVAVGDIDNDGDLDLYVTNFGSNVLYRNNGSGRFTDVTKQAGVDDPRWSTSASFLDYDGDADLDLFVTNYVDFTVKGAKPCYHPVGARDYCSPSVYQPVLDRLFRNEGSGRFRDVTESAGIGASLGAGLGVACRDFNSDGRVDIYVANDGTPNQLWINQGDGTFEDFGLTSGTAFNMNGEPEAGMGIAAADFDQDGDMDIFVTNLSKESNTLYLNHGSGNFDDTTIRLGLSGISVPFTGFGTKWFDYDNDGLLDLLIANGAVAIEESLLGGTYPYQQPNQLFHRESKDRFQEASRTAGEVFRLSEVSRGLALGDLDNDGDLDALISNNSGPARILLNQAVAGQHWLQVGLMGKEDNRFGIGARVALMDSDDVVTSRVVHSDGSYLSASDLRVAFGLGNNPQVKGVLVHWPSGRKEYWDNIEVNRLVKLEQGTGKPWRATQRTD